MTADAPSTTSARAWSLERIPAVWLVVAGIVSVQFGAAIAKQLFPLVPPTAMVWLRLVTSAVVLWLVVRPRLRGHRRADWAVALLFGVSLATMNWAIYQSFARIPLGIAVTIEFLGPLAVAVAGSRRPRDLLWVLLAALGVGLLGLSRTRLDPLGVLFALLAAAGWACYILLSARTGRRWPGISGLVVASLVGAVALGPPAVLEAGTRLLEPRVLLLGLAVGLLSSVIPYSLELVALRRIPPRVFGILMSLEPAVAALAAMLLLAEFLSPVQWVAMACVVLASVGSTRTAREPSGPATV
ncbi:inner membrane transporter RhtA [Friedmanniella luteola]|uniref:Inner membrane transporter RhtA n=1 Tax=Friedmanniella luteola TaxID=546871 RepID=A0A1H1LR19_9ACTN|nr:EamA family transporter [Friedmanniella luteola]SDR76963.1 inner membrane transporter RhtA [Friedmanniella luteola]